MKKAKVLTIEFPLSFSLLISELASMPLKSPEGLTGEVKQ